MTLIPSLTCISVTFQEDKSAQKEYYVHLTVA